MTTFTVYSRTGCHLCELMIEALLPLIRGRAELDVVDIDTIPALRDKYDIRVPVLALGDREICEYHLDPAAVEAVIPEVRSGA